MKVLKRDRILTVLLCVEMVILCLLFRGCFGRQDVLKTTSRTVADSNSVQQNGKEQIIYTDTLCVKAAAYDVTVNYESVTDSSHPNKKSYGDITGNVSFSLNRQGVLSNPLYLSDGTNTARTRIWVMTWVPVKDLQLTVNYEGKGQLVVKSIVLRENMFFRFTKILCFLVLAVLIDLIYMFVSGRYFAVGDRNRQLLLWGIIGIIVISSLPILGNSFYYGDDSFFHLHRIVSLSDAVKSGNIPQRVQLTNIHGYGYVSSLFYGEIFLFVPALLYLLCLPLQLCYQIYVVLVNTATCLITYWCVRKITKDSGISVLSSFVYTCSAYRLVNIYQRWAVGEYTAITFLPLIIYGFYHLYTMSEKESFKLKDYFPLVLGLTGIIQSHTLTVEMTAMLVLIFILFHLRETFKLKRFIALVKTVILTFLLNAWFLIPMISSLRQDMYIGHSENYLGSWTIDPALVFSIFDTGGGHHMTLGFSMLIGIILFIFIRILCSTWKKDAEMMRALNTLESLGIFTVILALPYVQWDNIYNLNRDAGKFFAVSQFSWRYFEFAAVFLTVGTGISLLVIKTNTSAAVYYTAAGSLILSTILFTSSFMASISLQGKASELSSQPAYYIYYMDNNESDPENKFDPIGVSEYISGGEYLPYATYKETLQSNNTMKVPEGVQVSDYAADGNRRKFSVKNSTKKAVEITIPLLAYDNYHAFLDNNRETSVSEDKDGLLQIQIPASYTGSVTVRYSEPVLWRVSEITTLVTITALCVYAIIRKRKKCHDGTEHIFDIC